jgi:hypothetical protein
MIRIEIKNWNGQFANRGVLAQIRRKIQGGQGAGTVLIDFEGALLTPEQVTIISAGWLAHKVKSCGSPLTALVPLPENILPPEPLPKPRQIKRTGPKRTD